MGREKKYFAARGLLIRNQSVLLVKEGKGKDAGLWNFPGGKVDEDPAVGLEEQVSRKYAASEIWQESGIRAKILELIDKYQEYHRRKKRPIQTYVFAAQYIGGELGVTAGDDVADARMFPLPSVLYNRYLTSRTRATLRKYMKKTS